MKKLACSFLVLLLAPLVALAQPTLVSPACTTPVDGYAPGTAYSCNLVMATVEDNSIPLVVGNVKPGNGVSIDIFLESACAYFPGGPVVGSNANSSGQVNATITGVYDGDRLRLAIYETDPAGNRIGVAPTVSYWLWMPLFGGTSPTAIGVSINSDGTSTISWTPPVGVGADKPDAQTGYSVVVYGPRGAFTVDSGLGNSSVRLAAGTLFHGDEVGIAVYPYRAADGFFYSWCNAGWSGWFFVP